MFITLKRKMQARKIRFDMRAIEIRIERVDSFCVLESVTLDYGNCMPLYRVLKVVLYLSRSYPT